MDEKELEKAWTLVGVDILKHLQPYREGDFNLEEGLQILSEYESTYGDLRQNVLTSLQMTTLQDDALAAFESWADDGYSSQFE